MYYIRVNYAMHKNQSVLLKKWVMPTVHSGPNSCQLSKKWTLIQPALYGQPVNTNTFYAPINVRINRFWLHSGYVSLRERVNFQMSDTFLVAGDSFHALRFPRWNWKFIKFPFLSPPLAPVSPFARAAHAYLLATSLHGGQSLMVLGSNYVTLIALQLYFGLQRCVWMRWTSVIDESDSLRRSSYSLGQEEML